MLVINRFLCLKMTAVCRVGVVVEALYPPAKFGHQSKLYQI